MNLRFIKSQDFANKVKELGYTVTPYKKGYDCGCGCGSDCNSYYTDSGYVFDLGQKAAKAFQKETGIHTSSACGSYSPHTYSKM